VGHRKKHVAGDHVPRRLRLAPECVAVAARVELTLARLGLLSSTSKRETYPSLRVAASGLATTTSLNATTHGMAYSTSRLGVAMSLPFPPVNTPTPMSYGPPWAHCLGGYQDRLLGGPLGLLGLCHTAPDGVGCKDYGGEVLG
jgi:hypothetical protein